MSVVSGDTRGFKIKVRRNIDDKVINVSIPEDTLTRDQIEILKNSEWAKKPVAMEINARVLRGDITSATLISAAAISRT
jgi:hypothetical protein